MKRRIDFKEIAESALSRAETLVPQWLSNGHRAGHEWRCGSLRGDAGSSLSVNLNTGVWADFASDEKGGDLISLYAAIFTDGDQFEAAYELQQNLGVVSTPSAPKSDSKPKAKRRSPWTPILDVPEGAPPLPVAHIKRGKPTNVWQYKDRQGKIIGAVYRFTKSDGGKEVLPCVWAKHETTGQQEWHWMSFSEPRPLYGLNRLTDRDVPVLVVEGEKCADAAHQLAADMFDVVTWPGGSKATSKADWSALNGRKVVIWPDADSQRVNDNDPPEFKPAEKQPGMQAALAIASELQKRDCRVYLIDIPAPGEKPDGWDIADFSDQEPSKEVILSWMRDRTRPFLGDSRMPPFDADVGGVEITKSRPQASAMTRSWWGERLLRKSRGGFEDCKENVAIALEDHSDLVGLVGYNEFNGRVEKVKPAPWDASSDAFRPVEWSIHDDRELGMWLAIYADLLFGSTGTVAEGVELVANRNRFHPVRDWLNGLEWDGVDRNSRWLTDLLGVADSEYASLVGSLWIRQAVNRILHPGSKGDYVLILEGTQGLNKSTALKRLGGEYYSDVTLNLNDKDSLIALAGVWMLEIAELDAFNRAESTRIKQFITQTEDRFRPPYGKRMMTLQRQTVFAATTNNYEYHKDPTGNRRFWSVLCKKIDLDKITDWREQMFAQAVSDVLQGEPCYPTRDQERTLIMPEQEQREIVDLWFEPISRWLSEAGQCQTNEFTSFEILEGAIGMAKDKMDGQRSAATRVGNVMAKMGWSKRRGERNKKRAWLYVRPESERFTVSASHTSAEDDIDIPF